MNLTHDITLNRHGGDACSAAAHEVVLPQKMGLQLKVERLIWSCGYGGATSKEIAAALRIPLHSISGRCSELLADGRAVKTDRRRKGCAVLVAPQSQGRLL